jgi:hypothetical protein
MSKKNAPFYTSADAEVEDPYPWRQWMFGGAHADSHNFAETVMERAPKEVFCAAAASLLVSPIVSIFDKSIVTAGSGKGEFLKAIMSQSKEMIVQPRQCFGGLPFVLTALVYFGTYTTANLSELALDVKKIRYDDQQKGASAVANIGLLAWRDSVFARVYLKGTVPTSTPMRTISLFATRDAATMYATFYAAPSAVDYLKEEYGVEQYTAKLSMALAIPVATQMMSSTDPRSRTALQIT